ncbi:MAG: SRPBCC family protein [Gemmatimonadales bacterium]
MWKWIGGCLLVCIAVVAYGLWTGYTKLSSFGSSDGTETVTVGAPVSRVFAALADADSLSTWIPEQSGVKVAHHGMLVVGDTLQGQMQLRFNVGKKQAKWTVSEVVPGKLLALELVSDSSGKLVARRQFSLSASGDSTRVTSAVVAPMLDSMRASRVDSGKPVGKAIDITSKLLLSALRMESHVELDRLKSHIEGHRASGKIP